MKASELRIGNYVYHEPTIDDWEIIQANPGTMIQCEINPDGFDPIPLTEEWLLKFGFEPLGSSRFDFKIFTYYLYDGSFYNQSSRLSTIKYVHQLQNLYFALTDEELEIKDNDYYR